MSLTPYQQNFLTAMRTAAGHICPTFAIPPQVCVAQSILETGWGGAKKSAGKTFQQFGEATGWNLWGIKGKGDAGSQNWLTKEYKGVKPNGTWITITAAFAKYSSLEAGVTAYCTLLSKDRYKLAKTHFSHDPGRYITYVWASGYATAPSYPESIMSLMRTVSAATGDASYNVVADAGLATVISLLGAKDGGKARMAVRDSELLSEFRLPATKVAPPLPVSEPEPEDCQNFECREPSQSTTVLDMDHDGDPDYLMSHLDMCMSTESENMSRA